jgi:hypothetical protein
VYRGLSLRSDWSGSCARLRAPRAFPFLVAKADLDSFHHHPRIDNHSLQLPPGHVVVLPTPPQAERLAPVHYVDKSDFLHLYIAARSEAITEQNARAGFRAAGLVPFDPSVVLDQLTPVPRTPTPPPPLPSSQELNQGWNPETPRTVGQIHKHACTLRKSLKRKTILTPSPTNLAAIQMAKAAEHAIYAYQLAQTRIAELEALVDVKKRKKTTGRKYIKNGKLLSASDVRQE